MAEDLQSLTEGPDINEVMAAMLNGATIGSIEKALENVARSSAPILSAEAFAALIESDKPNEVRGLINRRYLPVYKGGTNNAKCYINMVKLKQVLASVEYVHPELGAF